MRRVVAKRLRQQARSVSDDPQVVKKTYKKLKKEHKRKVNQS